MPHRTYLRPPLYLLALIVAGLVLTGCQGPTTISIRSTTAPAFLRLRPTLAIYAPIDQNTADFFLTDLTLDQLDPGTPLTEISGQITHIHMFIKPRAGRTPIANSACSATIRHFVLARGQIGVYSGGGFLFPSGKSGNKNFGGSIQKAPLRLTASTTGFADLIGPSELNARFNLPLDESKAKLVRRRMQQILNAANRTQKQESDPAA